MNVGMKRVLAARYDDALPAVTAALASEGFGILTEIDVKATLEKKLGVPFRRYKILGACNPTFAHRLLQGQLDAGVMLPCNVIVYENDDGGATVVAMDPMQTLASELASLRPIAEEVRRKLAVALDVMASSASPSASP